MAKTTGTITVKRSRNGTTIRVTGQAANALFNAMVKSVSESTEKPIASVPEAVPPQKTISHPTNS